MVKKRYPAKPQEEEEYVKVPSNGIVDKPVNPEISVNPEIATNPDEKPAKYPYPNDNKPQRPRENKDPKYYPNPAKQRATTTLEKAMLEQLNKRRRTIL